jgi:Protein of unknown function (DUF1569)
VATIFDSGAQTSLETRIRALRLDSPRQWGRMTSHEAVCHMSDVFRMALGDKTVSSRRAAFAPVVKFIALQLPMPWPRGIKTLPEVEQGCGGTTPGDFERDRSELLALMARFSAAPDSLGTATHPIFGMMSKSEWGRWGYRHLDHHLRQFGA